MPFVRDRQLRQPSLPGQLDGKLSGALAQLLHQGRGQPLPFPVGQGHGIDRIQTLAAMQYFQEVHPALAVGALEAGEQVVADHGAITVTPLVSGPGIIRADVGRGLKPRCSHLVLLLVERLVVLRQDATELALGNVDAEVMQLLQQQRLRHVRVVILVQNIAGQVWAIVTTRQHVGRQRRQHRTAVGQLIACPQVARCFGLDRQLLDNIRFIILENGSGRKVIGMQPHVFGDDELIVLGAFVRPRTFAVLRWRCRRGRFQSAGADLGSRLLAFEDGVLVP